MGSDSKPILFSALLATVLFLLGGVYYSKLVVSKNRIIEKGSIDYFLVTPALIKNFPVHRFGEIKHYYYSAAEDNKPVLNAIEFVAEGGQIGLQQNIKTYFRSIQFREEAGKLRNGTQEIATEFNPIGSNLWEVKVVLLEYVN